jgi:F0F1-type ATP synthase assembly protein I
MVTVTRSLELKARDVYRLLLVQLSIVAGAALVVFLGWGRGPALGVAYGGAVALASAWLLGRRLRRTAEQARTSPGWETASLYAGAVERFVFVLGMFWLAMGHLALPAPGVLVGFGLAQLAYYIAGAMARSGVERAGARVEKWG